MADRLMAQIEVAPPAAIVTDEAILGGMPVVSGTRVPAATIAAYLRAGHTNAEIRSDHPSLPNDGIEAVEAWAADEFGPD